MIPIIILTGFLGSGKTTLINHILQGDHGIKIAIVENEFGESSIDSLLIERSDEEIITVSNGCMCCQVRKDWIDAIERLLDSGKEIDAIIIEASGASEPLPIAQSFLMNDMGGRVKLDSILCMIDALNYDNLFSASVDIALAQLEHADFIILNKTDLVDDEKLVFLETAIRRVNTDAPILRTDHAQVDLGIVIGNSRFLLTNEIETALGKKHIHGHTHLEHFRYVTKQKFILRELDAVFKDLSPDYYRAKGFVQFTEKGDTWFLLQKSGARIMIEPWNSKIPEISEIVFIGQNMHEDIVRKMLDASTESGRSVLFT